MAIGVALVGSGMHQGLAQARPLIGAQLDLGARGNDVTTLQAFLATDRVMYPEGLVTGYFGPLTQKAVMQFQLGYGIPPVGRVGPLTREKLNSLIAAGSSIDIYAPTVSNLSANVSGSKATLVWNTNEIAKAKVFYDTKPIVYLETSRPQTEPVISGAVSSDTSVTTAKEVVLNDLLANTTYYFAVEAIDLGGNVSLVIDRTFRTQ